MIGYLCYCISKGKKAKKICDCFNEWEKKCQDEFVKILHFEFPSFNDIKIRVKYVLTNNIINNNHNNFKYKSYYLNVF